MTRDYVTTDAPHTIALLDHRVGAAESKPLVGRERLRVTLTRRQRLSPFVQAR